MKLIHCKECHDVVRLIETRWRQCECKRCGGQYNADLMTATIGGDCDVIGIPNPFFDETFKFLIEENGGRDWYRKKHGWGKQDIWYGGNKGDNQLHYIKSPNGPRLKTKVEWVDKDHTKTTILDKRDYIIDGGKPKFVIVGNLMQPSFKKSAVKKKKQNKK